MKFRLKLFFTLACLLSLLSPSLAWIVTNPETLEPSLTTSTESWFGAKLRSAGDFNGDGIEDILVLGYLRQVVHVIFGNPDGLSGIEPESMTLAQGITITAEREFADNFVSAGDLNDDGIDDIIISDFTSNDAPFGEGSVFIIYGKRTDLQSFSLAEMTPEQGRKIVPGIIYSEYGSVLNAGDFNGDGKQDIFLSGRRNPEGTGEYYETTLVMYGGYDWPFIFNVATDSIPEGQGFKITRESAYYSMTADVGDVNGDGRDDFIAAADNVVYVIWGDPSRTEDIQLSSLTSSQGIKIQGDQYTDFSYGRVTVLGDVNGDQISDFAIACMPLNTVFVFFGSRDSLIDFSLSELPGPRGYIIRRTNPDDIFLSQPFRANDLNGDGLNDILLVGIREVVNGVDVNSGIYVIYGSRSAKTTVFVDNFQLGEGLKITFPFVPYRESLAAVDLNGDKAVDLAFAMYQMEQGQYFGGVYIMYQPEPCDFPLIHNSDQTLCIEPCPTGGYFKQGQCSDTCGTLWVASTVNGVDVCSKPCTGGQTFNTHTSTCQTGCVAPWLLGTQDDVAVCKKPCQDEEEDYFWNSEEETCQEECPALWIATTELDVLVCKKPCSGEEEVWNSESETCQDACDSPWVSTTQDDVTVCSKPCASGQTFNTNTSTCQTGCDTPWISTTELDVLVCKKPCPPEQFWNSEGETCQLACDPPLISRIQDDVDTCVMPCEDGEFWNIKEESCQEGCDAPWVSRTQDGLVVCDKPCVTGEYLNTETQTCQTGCNAPWAPSTESDVLVCKKPCPTQQVWNSESEACQLACDAPWVSTTQDDVTVCSKPCASGQTFNTHTSTCQTVCAAPWISTTQDGVAICSKPCEDGEFWNSEEESCQDECADPWVITPVNGVETCESPCETGEVWDEDKQECVDPDVSNWEPTLVNNLGVMLLSFIFILFN